MVRKVKKPFERQRSQTKKFEKSLTQQSHAKRANINNIMKDYEKTGLLPVVNAKPLYAETPAAQSYHDAMNLVVEAQQTFNELPAVIRAEFANDPAKFLEFVENEENADKLIEMGLREAPPVETAETVKMAEGSGDAAAETTPSAAAEGENTA